MRFSDRTLRRFWRTGRAKGIDPRSAEHLKELLSALDAAVRPADMANRVGIFIPSRGTERASMPSKSGGFFAWFSSGKTMKLCA